LFMTGPRPTAAQAEQSAADTPDVLKAFGPIAKRWNNWYVLDLIESEGGRLYHTAFVIGPNGNVVDKYRKAHLTDLEKDWATPGEEYRVLQLPFGNVGLMTGHEVCFFEVARVLTCMGADIIAMPSNFRAPREAHLFARERALENKIFVVAANRTDAAYPGSSTVIFPNAATPHKAGTEQGDYVFAYVNLAWARDKQIRPGTDLVRNRRPQFYDPLVQPILV